jgi:hypothetical protein
MRVGRSLKERATCKEQFIVMLIVAFVIIGALEFVVHRRDHDGCKPGSTYIDKNGRLFICAEANTFKVGPQ